MKEGYRIVLVEDDDDQRQLTIDLIKGDLNCAGITEIVSEERFRTALGEGKLAGCHIVVMDVMLPWTTLETFVPMPENIAREKYYKAGIRCIRELRSQDREIPVIIYTHVEPHEIIGDLKQLTGVDYVNKAQPMKLLNLLKTLFAKMPLVNGQAFHSVN